jgi:hypothetical protein
MKGNDCGYVIKAKKGEETETKLAFKAFLNSVIFRRYRARVICPLKI